MGFSAFSTCILVDQTNQIGEFKRFAHVVIGPAFSSFLSKIAVAGQHHVRDLSSLIVRFQRAAKLLAAHAFDRQVGENHRRQQLFRSLQRRLSVGDDLTLTSCAPKDQGDQAGYLRVVFHDENHELDSNRMRTRFRACPSAAPEAQPTMFQTTSTPPVMRVGSTCCQANSPNANATPKVIVAVYVAFRDHRALSRERNASAPQGTKKRMPAVAGAIAARTAAAVADPAS